MTRRLQILIDDEEYIDIQRAARGQRMTVSEWVRRALCKARADYSRTAEAKLRAIADASRYEFPTADIDDMLWEIEVEQRAQ